MTTPDFVDLMFNERVPALANSVVRHAIGIAINRSALVAGALGRQRRRDPDEPVLRGDPVGRTSRDRGDLTERRGVRPPGQRMDARLRRCAREWPDATRVHAGSAGHQPAPGGRARGRLAACGDRRPGDSRIRCSRRPFSAGRSRVVTSNSRSTHGIHSRTPTSARSGGPTRSRRTATTCRPAHPTRSSTPLWTCSLSRRLKAVRVSAAAQVAALIAGGCPGRLSLHAEGLHRLPVTRAGRTDTGARPGVRPLRRHRRLGDPLGRGHRREALLLSTGTWPRWWNW